MLNVVLEEALDEKATDENVCIGQIVIRGNSIVIVISQFETLEKVRTCSSSNVMIDYVLAMQWNTIGKIDGSYGGDCLNLLEVL